MSVAGLLLLAAQALADETNEDRLRDALRQSVTQMRAAQDQAAQATSDLQKAQQDRAALQTQLDAANAKLAEQSGKPAAKPEELAGLQSALAASRQQTASYQQALGKFQSAYQAASQAAQAKTEEAAQTQAGLKADGQALQTCKTENTRLTDVAEQILHLYESQDFRGLLLRSYEPLIGSAKVKLENLVQDYDDKIRDQEYVAPAHAVPVARR